MGQLSNNDHREILGVRQGQLPPKHQLHRHLPLPCLAQLGLRCRLCNEKEDNINWYCNIISKKIFLCLFLNKSKTSYHLNIQVGSDDRKSLTVFYYLGKVNTCNKWLLYAINSILQQKRNYKILQCTNLHWKFKALVFLKESLPFDLLYF